MTVNFKACDRRSCHIRRIKQNDCASSLTIMSVCLDLTFHTIVLRRFARPQKKIANNSVLLQTSLKDGLRERF